MATWKAEVWESGFGHYDVTVEAPTWGTARQKICQIYDVEPNEVVNLCETNGMVSSLSQMGDIGGWIIIAAIIFCIWLFMEYFWIMMPLTVIALIAWIYNTFLIMN